MAGLNRQTVEYFIQYCKTVFKYYRGKVKYWMTFNEINLLRGYDTLGVHEMTPLATIKPYIIFSLLSAKAVILGHKIDSNNQLG